MRSGVLLEEKDLRKLYIDGGKSASAIASLKGCSENKVYYWLEKFKIQKRTISDAIYQFHNPNGDPFSIAKVNSLERAFLLGAGIGLYWGEGTKSNKTSIRLGNSDPRLIKVFMKYLEEMYSVDRTRLRFGLQVFSQGEADRARVFWKKELGVSARQFYKTIITPSRGVGTYGKKMPHGVLTVYFNNRKLRDIICRAIDDFDGVLSGLR